MQPGWTDDVREMSDEAYARYRDFIRQIPSFQADLNELAVKTRQETLLRLLRHKFGDLPQDAVSRVQATTDPATIDRWLDDVLDASTPAEMGL